MTVIEVAIGPGGAPRMFKVEVVVSPAGEASATVELDAEGLLARRGLLQQAVLASAVPSRRVLPETEQPLREVGQLLFAGLLGTGEVAGRYRAAAAVAAERGEGLRVVLRIDTPALAGLPWEAMYDQAAGAYVCRQNQLVRHVRVASVPAPLRVRPPLRILGVVSSPRGLPPLDVEKEQDQLARALARPAGQGLAEVHWAPTATWADLQDLLLDGEWHVLHFIGHGDFDPGQDEGVLALTREDGRADLVAAHRLVDLLRQARPMPRLAVLNSCSGAAAGVSDLFSGTAAALVRGGVSAVAAMQYEISDPAAVAFARGFYAAIARGRGVDDAVSSGRVAILGLSDRTLEWVTPVLYLRGHNSQLFTLPAPAEDRNRDDTGTEDAGAARGGQPGDTIRPGAAGHGPRGDSPAGKIRLNELAEAKREFEQKFGRYKEVRELAAEIVYLMDSGFISRSVILDVTERLAILTPRYWLAPTILAVAAWLDNDQDRYSESINVALALDPSKTALFMTLLLRHQARTEVMRDWTGCYLAGLDPINLPTDFAVVIEAVAGGTLGADSAPLLARRMRGWYENAARSRDVQAEEIGQWERNLLTLAAADDYAEQFPTLARSSPTWELLRKRHEANTAVEATDQHFRSRFDDGAEVPADLDEKISLLFKHLAEDPDPAEDQILRKIRRAEAVIETKDDAAAHEADRTRALNILSLVTRAAFPPGRGQPPTMTELLAIVLSQRFISQAAENIHGKHRHFDTVQIKLGQRGCEFSCATDAEVTPDALRRQAEDSAKGLADEIDREIFQQGKKLLRRARLIQEKSDIQRTLDRASDELAELFSQEQRSRDLLPALRAYLMGLTAERCLPSHQVHRTARADPHAPRSA